jgi:hypothetical protein
MARAFQIEKQPVYSDNQWTVTAGELKPASRNRRGNHLFKYVAEKLPWAALGTVVKYLKTRNVERQGVYLAHDSFGVARYGGAEEYSSV